MNTLTTWNKLFAALFALALACCATPAHAQTTWTSGVSYAWTVQGGLSALPAIAGVSINPGSTARVYDSGGTVYQYRAVFSGTTVNNSPYRISPSDLQAGGTNSGTSMWELQGLTGDTVWARTLVIDARTVTGNSVDAWNAIQSNVTEYVAEKLRTYLASDAFTGTTDFALDSAVTEFVRGVIRDVLAAAAFSGTTEFSTVNAMRAAILSAVSAYTLHSNHAAALASGAFTGVTEFQNLAAVRSAALSAVSPHVLHSAFAAALASAAFTGVTEFKKLGDIRNEIESYVTPYPTTAQSRAYADSAVTPYALDSKLNAQLVPGAVSSVSLYAIPALADDHSGTSIYVLNFAVVQPENLLPGGGTTPFKVFDVDPTAFPSGVTVIGFVLRVTSGGTEYGLTIEEWDGNSKVQEIGKVWAGSLTGNSGYQTGVTVVQAGHEVFVSPPTTGAHIISGSMKYVRRK